MITIPLITIPLYVALFVFWFWAVFSVIFFLLNVYHLAKSASLTFTSFVMTCLIAASVAFILFGSWFLLQETNWQAPIISFSGFGI
jgi:hypothetical protein